MSKSATSVLVFGVYLVLLGLLLVIVPNVLLRFFGFAMTAEVWVRVVGVLVLCLAFYYVQAARRELVEFFQWTVIVRAFVFVCLAFFAVLKLAAPQLALFGCLDLLGSVWTALCLRQSRPPVSAA
jgi:hypothetical protein